MNIIEKITESIFFKDLIAKINSLIDNSNEVSGKVEFLDEIDTSKFEYLDKLEEVDNKASKTELSAHNTSETAHNDIRLLIQGLATRLNALADSDDTTLDQMSEIVAYIKANKSLIESITTDKVNVSDIINNLETNATNKPLSAAQGVALKQLVDALWDAKNSGELDGHSPVKGVDYTPSEKEEIISELSSNETLIGNVAEVVKIEVPLVKTAEQPTFVNSVDECIDTSKVYVLPDGYFYAYTERETNGGNYNLLKISEVTYASRLQDNAEDVISSTVQNVVSGWFPVTYGKYYTMSTIHDDIGRSVLRFSLTRVQLKLADGTIKLYSLSSYPNTVVSGCPVYGIDDENAIAMRVQIQIKSSSSTQADISTAANLRAYYPMIVEGDSATGAYNNALNLDYIDGDAEVEVIEGWYNTGLAYNQPADYEDRVIDLESDVTKLKNDATVFQSVDTSMLYEAQKYITDDWRIPFIDVFHKLGLGGNHIIPNSYNVWGGTGNDLTQKNVMMSDGVHPYMGDGVTMMYAQSIIPQIEAVPPLYSSDSEHDDWMGKTMLWMGTSIPAGSDPALGVNGIGTTYPSIAANKLGATCINIAKGSSCVRINSSSGDYRGFKYSHLIRALSRTTAEADMVQANWGSIKANVVEAASIISDIDLAIMKEHSFETLLLPYLDGTNTMPDLFVLDHGHNDIRPLGMDGKQDSLVKPTVENIKNGTLAVDTYMTDNNYANLKIAFNNDLSKIADIESFAASVNRNCLIGAINFIITLIYSYNPKARIIIVSDYN